MQIQQTNGIIATITPELGAYIVGRLATRAWPPRQGSSVCPPGQVSMRETCTALGAELREFNGEEDHVHHLVFYPPTLAITALVMRLRGISSDTLRAENRLHMYTQHMRGHLWSPAYFAAHPSPHPRPRATGHRRIFGRTRRLGGHQPTLRRHSPNHSTRLVQRSQRSGIICRSAPWRRSRAMAELSTDLHPQHPDQHWTPHPQPHLRP
jgi:hypothetical protein